MNSLYSFVLNKKPDNRMDRNHLIDEVVLDFCKESPSYKIYWLSGVRGIGKTASLQRIVDQLNGLTEWVIVELSTEKIMLVELVAELSRFTDPEKYSGYSKQEIYKMKNEDNVAVITVELSRIFDKLTKAGKKVLVCIDEITVDKNFCEFIRQYQRYIKENCNLFLVMTGTYDDIYKLQDYKSLAFLYSAPIIYLKPLDISLISNEYMRMFSIDETEAMNMAKYTKGYPFAYQLLGYLCTKKNTGYKNVSEEYYAYLYEYVYEKIWAELSLAEKQIAEAMTNSKTTDAEDIRKLTNMTLDEFSINIKKLSRNGILEVDECFKLTFVLPNFGDFILVST